MVWYGIGPLRYGRVPPLAPRRRAPVTDPSPGGGLMQYRSNAPVLAGTRAQEALGGGMLRRSLVWLAGE
jgi:hypothetical protein